MIGLDTNILLRLFLKDDPAQAAKVTALLGRLGETGPGYVNCLTLMECDLLRYLVKNAGQPVSRRAILQEVWGLAEGVDTRAIDNFIVRLRRYIEDRPAAPKFLQTVRGVGYRFVPQPLDRSSGQ